MRKMISFANFARVPQEVLDLYQEPYAKTTKTVEYNCL